MVGDGIASTGPDAGPAVDETRQRRRARLVTYSMVVVLLLVAAVHLELWPLTAFRLFSEVRTGTGSSIGQRAGSGVTCRALWSGGKLP